MKEVGMENLKFSGPVLDSRELELIKKLTEDYKKFSSQGPISKATKKFSRGIDKITPEKLKNLVSANLDAIAEIEFLKFVFRHASKGFEKLSEAGLKSTLSHKRIVKVLRDNGCKIEQFENICLLRSYKIEPIVFKQKNWDLLAAFAEGAATGAPGFPGIPFNLVLSFLLFFRAVQRTALFYGYDVKNDPREMAFASDTTMFCLAPNIDTGTETLGGLIGKMMFAANVSALKQALGSKTYTQMAKKGGGELLYVQIRALANKAAKKALKGAGKEGLELGVFRNLMEQIAKRLPKEVGKRSIPLVAAIVGGLSDTYYMNRILDGSNLIYHKRFLLEKVHRVNLLGETIVS